MVVRSPGACRITVPAERHFLDVNLGKSDAVYEISGLEALGDVAPPGTFVFLPANGEREIKATRSGWSVQLAFDTHLLDTNTVPKLGTVPSDETQLGLRAICHAEDDSMVSLAQQVSGLWRSDLPLPNEEQVDAVAILLMMRAAHHVVYGDPHPPRSSSVSKRIQQVLDHIESDLSAPHSLAELAAIAGTSTYHFARMFRQATGRSPHQYVVERRLAHAKRRLSFSDDPIVEIALDCGFGSQSHMTDVFNKVLGTTPGALRRSLP